MVNEIKQQFHATNNNSKKLNKIQASNEQIENKQKKQQKK